MRAVQNSNFQNWTGQSELSLIASHFTRAVSAFCRSQPWSTGQFRGYQDRVSSPVFVKRINRIDGLSKTTDFFKYGICKDILDSTDIFYLKFYAAKTMLNIIAMRRQLFLIIYIFLSKCHFEFKLIHQLNIPRSQIVYIIVYRIPV